MTAPPDLERIVASDDPAAPLRAAVADGPLLRALNTRVLWSFFSGYAPHRRPREWSARVGETALELLEEGRGNSYGRQWLLEMAFHASLAVAGTEDFHRRLARTEQALALIERNESSRSAHYVKGLLAYAREDAHGAEHAFAAIPRSSPKPLLEHHAGYPAFRAPGFYQRLQEPDPSLSFDYVTAPRMHPDTSTVIVCSADDAYFDAFAEEFAQHVFNVAPTACVHFHLLDNTVPLRRLVTGDLLADERIHLTSERVCGTAMRTYTTMARYMLVPFLIERWQRPVLVSDIDTVLTTDPATLAGGDPVTLLLSRNSAADYLPTMKVLAGHAHFDPTAPGLAFAQTLSRYLSHVHAEGVAGWTVDQVALLAVWRMLRNSIPVRGFADIPAYRAVPSADRPRRKEQARERVARIVEGA